MIFLLLACFVVIVFLLPYGLISANPFPTPSGQWKVGTSNFIWNLPSHSGIIAKIWYPSSTKQDSHSPYIDYLDRTLSAMTTGLNPLSKLILNRLYLGRIQAPATIDATLAQSQDGFPTILLSPGFGGVNFLNTFYALEFASHGFIVIDSRVAKSVDLDGFLYMDQIDITSMKKEFLLMLSNRDKYVSKGNKPQNSFDVVMAKDKARIEQFARHANVHKHLLHSANHFNFMDLPLILNPVFRVVLFLKGWRIIAIFGMPCWD